MKKWIIVIVSAIAFGSCEDFIDLKPENAVTYTNGMETPKDLEALVSSTQAILQGVLGQTFMQEMTGAYCNGARGGGMGLTPPGEAKAHLWYNSMADNGNWAGHYAAIGYANIVESNIKSTWSKEHQDYFLGQAQFAKAICYWDLARRWGKVPIVPDNDYEAPMLPVSSNADVLAAATRYALKAFEVLPRYKELRFSDGNQMDNKQYGNKEICAALLAQIYAWRATVQEDITSAQSDEYWKESEHFASLLIDGELKDYVSLEPSIDALMENTLNNRYGIESIMELEYNTKYTKVMPTNDFYIARRFFGYPHLHGSQQGDVPEMSISCKMVNELYGENTSDLRKNAFFVTEHYDPSVTYTWPDEPASVKMVEMGWPGSGWFVPQIVGGYAPEAPNRAYPKKFYKQFIYSSNPNEPEQFQNFDCNKIIWRLADIILLRAEVRNFMGKSDLAIADLNKIRSRANAALYPAPDDKNDLQYAIFHEREKELIYENHRFFDIMRNKGYYQTELPANIRMLSNQDVKDGALYLPECRDASEFNKLMTPNIYWFKKRN